MKKRLIKVQDILEAAEYIGRIFTDDNTIVTPAAADMAREKNVQIEYNPKAVRAIASVGQSEEPVIDEVFPVKVVALASDHGGFELKKLLIPYLRDLGYITHDLGPDTDKPCDYPDYAIQVAQMVAETRVDRGIMIDRGISRD